MGLGEPVESQPASLLTLCLRLKLVLLRTAPDIPLGARWIKTSATFGWYRNLNAIHSIAGKLFRLTLDPKSSDSALSAPVQAVVSTDLVALGDIDKRGPW